MSDRPVIVLAFANEQEGRRHLRELPREARELREALQGAADRGLCELEVRSNATMGEIEAVFARHGRRIKVFHYAGHAGPDRLLLESDDGTRAAHAGGLARFLGLQGGLQLAFLNGCSTGPQVADLLASGVDAVLATARPIGDEVARGFAVAFYNALAAGRTFRDAYELAVARARADRGDHPRDVMTQGAHFAPEDITDDRGFPWKLSVRDGAEAVNLVTLSQLAGDPLLGLPPLPTASWLPPTPYRHLLRFTRAEARVFFGRGREIADLYHLVASPTSRRVILYSGPTGVGKSSVLEAGLLPRLEAADPGFEVFYLRRDGGSGLLGTLTAALKTRDRPDRPLVAILDQAEEAFTRPRLGITPVAEVAELVDALKDRFAGPADRLILGFRKEWLQEFERGFDAARLACESVKLAPMDRAGLVEAIEGPTRDPDLRRRYGLIVEPGLADRIAVELEADAGSALAPTFQVLMTKLWEAAGGAGASFTAGLYDRLKDEGFLLKDVLDGGLKALGAIHPDAVDSGFGLDLLDHHTTSFGTAETCSRPELIDRYPSRAAILDDCLRAFEGSYLLIPADPEPADARATRLGHDTLAALVQDRFLNSPAPGQLARRILENRASGWEGGRDGPTLDDPDLSVVQAGAPGMRAPTLDEQGLIAASIAARDRRCGKARAIRWAFATAGCLLLLLAGWGYWNERRLAESGREAKDNLASSYLQALGQSAEVTPAEVAALEALARMDDPVVRSRFFELALESSSSAAQFSNRAEAAVACAVRLDPEMRRGVHDLVIARLKRLDDSREPDALAVRVACVQVGIELGSADLPDGEIILDQARALLGGPSADRLMARMSIPLIADLVAQSPPGPKEKALIRMVEMFGRGSFPPSPFSTGQIPALVASIAPSLDSRTATGVTLALLRRLASPDFQRPDTGRSAEMARGMVSKLWPRIASGDWPKIAPALADYARSTPGSALRALDDMAAVMPEDLARPIRIRIAARVAQLAPRASPTLSGLTSLAWALERIAPDDKAEALRAIALEIEMYSSSSNLSWMSGLLPFHRVWGTGAEAERETIRSLRERWRWYPEGTQGLIATRAVEYGRKADPRTLEALSEAVALLDGEVGRPAIAAIDRRARELAPDVNKPADLFSLARALELFPGRVCDATYAAIVARSRRFAEAPMEDNVEELDLLARALATIRRSMADEAQAILARRIDLLIASGDAHWLARNLAALSRASASLPAGVGHATQRSIAARFGEGIGTADGPVDLVASSLMLLPPDVRASPIKAWATRIGVLAASTDAGDLERLSAGVKPLPPSESVEARRAIAARAVALAASADPGTLSRLWAAVGGFPAEIVEPTRPVFVARAVALIGSAKPGELDPNLLVPYLDESPRRIGPSARFVLMKLAEESPKRTTGERKDFLEATRALRQAAARFPVESLILMTEEPALFGLIGPQTLLPIIAGKLSPESPPPIHDVWALRRWLDDHPGKVPTARSTSATPRVTP